MILSNASLSAAYLNAGDEVLLNASTHTKHYFVSYAGSNPFIFMDSGGEFLNYKENEDYNITFISENGLIITPENFEFEHEFSSMYDRLGIQVADEPNGEFLNLNRRWMLESVDPIPPWDHEKASQVNNEFDKLRRGIYLVEQSLLSGYIFPANLEEARTLGLAQDSEVYTGQNSSQAHSTITHHDNDEIKTNLSVIHIPYKVVRFHFSSDYSRNYAGWKISIAPFPEVMDTDGDTLSDIHEINLYGTDPNCEDTDADGLSDSDEIHIYASNPNETDTDKDGLNDFAESNLKNLSFDMNVENSSLIRLLNQAGFISDKDIGELRIATSVIADSGSEINFVIELEESLDLENWMKTGEKTVISFPVTSDKQFYRLKISE